MLGLDFSWLVDALNAVLCAVENLSLSFLAVIVMAINGLIISIGGYVSLLAALLPTWSPGFGTFDGGILQWLNWIIPLGPILSIWTTLAFSWGAIFVARIALRWVKAL